MVNLTSGELTPVNCKILNFQGPTGEKTCIFKILILQMFDGSNTTPIGQEGKILTMTLVKIGKL